MMTAVPGVAKKLWKVLFLNDIQYKQSKTHSDNVVFKMKSRTEQLFFCQNWYVVHLFLIFQSGALFSIFYIWSGSWWALGAISQSEEKTHWVRNQRCQEKLIQHCMTLPAICSSEEPRLTWSFPHHCVSLSLSQAHVLHQCNLSLLHTCISFSFTRLHSHSQRLITHARLCHTRQL